MAVIGSLAVNIVAKTEAFTRGIKAAQKAAGEFLNKTSLLSAGLSAGIIGLLHNFDELGSSLHDMATKTGVSTETLSALKYAAEQSGASMGTLNVAFKNLQKAGIDPNQFFAVADSIRAIQDPTERAQKALAMFGKKGTELLPMIMELPQLRAEFEKLGGTVTTEMANKADALGDSWGKLKVAMGAVANHIAAAIAPAITSLNEYVAANGKAIADWIDGHSSLVKSIGLVMLALPPLTAAAWGFNQSIQAILTSLGLLKAAASAPILAKILGSSAGAAAGAVGATVGLGAIGYQIYKESSAYTGPRGTSGGWESNDPKNAEKQLREIQRTNQLLEQQQQQRGGVVLGVAGVR